MMIFGMKKEKRTRKRKERLGSPQIIGVNLKWRINPMSPCHP